MDKILGYLATATITVIVTVTIFLGIGFNHRSTKTATELPPPSISSQIKGLQTNLHGIQTVEKGIETQTADTNQRVKDIQDRLKRCPCDKPVKKTVSRRTIIRKRAPGEHVAVASARQTPRARQPAILLNVPPTVVVDSNNNAGSMFPPLLETLPLQVAAPSPSIGQTTPTSVPRTEQKKESRLLHLWQNGWCGCGSNEFSPRWGSKQHHH